MRRNERKLIVLRFVRDNEGVSARDVEDGLDLEFHRAGMCLYRYWVQGLLYRHSYFGLHKVYEISPKGLKRIAWLEKKL